MWMAPIDEEVRGWSGQARARAQPIIERGGAEEGDQDAVRRVDELSEKVNERVHAFTAEALGRGKLPVLVGGDHSTPFGAIRAAAEHTPGIGVLQFDAHADLRPAFEGFHWSHASILHNVLDRCEGVASLVQVGIRDLCEQEYDVIQGDPRVRTVFDVDLDAARAESRMRALARETIETLPSTVYVTFDVDALDPALCPNTGTPVPNGLRWDETMVWLDELARSEKRVIGLDLNEVSAGEGFDPEAGEDPWDAIVGARLLYRLIGAAVAGRWSAARFR